MKKTSSTAPIQVETAHNSFKQVVRTINFDIVEPEGEDGKYVYESLVIPPGCFTYDGIVSLLIRYKYPDDKMAAIQNNYLAALGKTTPDAVAASDEFFEMQAWRVCAKNIAREALLCIG